MNHLSPYESNDHVSSPESKLYLDNTFLFRCWNDVPCRNENHKYRKGGFIRSDCETCLPVPSQWFRMQCPRHLVPNIRKHNRQMHGKVSISTTEFCVPPNFVEKTPKKATENTKTASETYNAFLISQEANLLRQQDIIGQMRRNQIGIMLARKRYEPEITCATVQVTEPKGTYLWVMLQKLAKCNGMCVGAPRVD
ncbi:hypothetical protein MRB53_041767 [Persea americana]|nr:hypothetical protein MRB53_041767 [Persea americana]